MIIEAVYYYLFFGSLDWYVNDHVGALQVKMSLNRNFELDDNN
jgi:hypothetical protein